MILHESPQRVKKRGRIERRAPPNGMLGYFSCLSREYGLPAISLPGAMKLIPDDSTITMNGSNGEVQMEDGA